MIPSRSARILGRRTGIEQNDYHKKKEAARFQSNTVSVLFVHPAFLNKFMYVLLSFGIEIKRFYTVKK